MTQVTFEPATEDDIAFFAGLAPILDAVSDVRRAHLEKHLYYLAEKAEIEIDAIVSGSPFEAPAKVISDARTNLSHVLEIEEEQLGDVEAPRPKKHRLRSKLPKPDVLKVIDHADEELDGWCTRAKAVALAQIIADERPQLCVEVGVYGGRSLVACAAALRNNGSGFIYGIEAWRNDVATEFSSNPADKSWWEEVNFPRIKKEFYRFVWEHELTWHVRMIEARSKDAVHLFDQIDFLHLDGAHSVVNSAEDVVLYLRKLRKGGIIALDDIDWKTNMPAYEIAKSICTTEAILRNEETGRESCAILRKI
jgi:predicted O-methyltransferase YrrM